MRKRDKRKLRVDLELRGDLVEKALLDFGFISRHKERFSRLAVKNPEVLHERPRFIFEFGKWKALSPNLECPWWTIQEWSGQRVTFVDFHSEVPAERIIAYISA